MDNPVVVPHQGRKPDWLEDDARINHKDAAQIDGFYGRADELNWRLPHPAFKYDRPGYFLPADHWAAPVLRAGLVPWNPKLQGDGPPKDYAGGKVMWGAGGISTAINANTRDWRSIVGYEPTPSQPASPPHESAGELLPCPFCGGQPRSEWNGCTQAGDDGYWSIECCHVHVHLDDEAEAVAAWNQRSPDLQAENARLRGALDAETGWLIEENNGVGVHWIALSPNAWPRIKSRRLRDSDIDEYLTPVERVKDASKALRFARKEDAEAMIALFDGFLLFATATEHRWD